MAIRLENGQPPNSKRVVDMKDEIIEYRFSDTPIIIKSTPATKTNWLLHMWNKAVGK